MKKIISLILCLTLVLSFTSTAFAQNNNVQLPNDNEYSLFELGYVESQIIDGVKYTYKYSTGKNGESIITTTSINGTDVMISDNTTGKLYFNGEELDISISYSNAQQSVTPYVEWIQIGEPEEYALSFGASITTNALASAIAIKVASKVTFFTAAAAALITTAAGTAGNCSFRKTVFWDADDWNPRCKYNTDVYWGRNFDEYIETVTWTGTR